MVPNKYLRPLLAFLLAITSSCTVQQPEQPSKHSSQYTSPKSLSSAYLDSRCEFGSTINPDSVDNLVKAAFVPGGNPAAYHAVFGFYAYYQKEYLMLSFVMKYSNLYRSSQASFDVYAIMSNLFDKPYLRKSTDKSSKKVALYYLFKAHREDPAEQLFIVLIEKMFGAGWRKYEKVDFLNYKDATGLPELVSMKNMRPSN